MLDAERTLLQAEQQYATSTTNVSLDLVQLFKALGGGWETEFPDVPSETAASCHSGQCLAGQCRAGQCARRAGAGSALMGCAGPT